MAGIATRCGPRCTPIRPDSDGEPLTPDGGCGHSRNMTIGSAHSGGANCLNGDGSVDTVGYGVDQEVFSAYAHRHDGELFELNQ